MKRFARLALVLGLVALPSAPAMAGWKLMSHGEAASVAKGTLTVTPDADWNRNTSRPIKKSEVWTIDGTSLNELYFVSALAPGETLLKDVDKKNRPLPKMSKGMLLTDIPDFVESTMRVALNTSIFEVTRVAAAKLGEQPAVRFDYELAFTGSSLKRKGTALATVVDDQLYLINFIAPEIHYYDRDLPRVEAIMASARF